MTKKQRYLEISAKNTPDFVRAIPVAGKGYRGMAHACEEEDDEGFLPMQVPTPDTFQRLWTYLHECAHMRLHGCLPAEGNNYSRGEAEAELEVLRILDEEQITIPLKVLVSRYDYVLSHAREDDRKWERHLSVTECLDEFARRITTIVKPEY